MNAGHKNHPTALELYEKKLIESGVGTKEEADSIHNKINKILNDEFLASKDHVPDRRDRLSANWTGFKSPDQLSPVRNTECVIFSLHPIASSSL